MKILVVCDEKDVEGFRKYAKEKFGILRDTEFVFISEYDSDWLRVPLADLEPVHGDFDALVVTSLQMSTDDINIPGSGMWGLVFAAQAGKRNIPCVVAIEPLPRGRWMENIWLWHLVSEVGACTVEKHTDFMYQTLIELCEEFRRRGIEYR
jgi:hypothetical protein